MSEPKILLHKPKKSLRTPPGVSPVNAAFHDGVGARGVSTATEAPPPPPPVPKEPIWYRFRTALTTLLVVNAALVGYTLFKTNFKSVESFKEADSEKKEKEGEEKAKETEKESKKPKIVDTKSETPELTKSKASASKSTVRESSKVTLAAVPPQPVVPAVNKPKPSDQEQQELYKWMLAEKRKMKPTTKAEKAQIDAEKALLKEYLRGKNALNL